MFFLQNNKKKQNYYFRQYGFIWSILQIFINYIFSLKYFAIFEEIFNNNVKLKYEKFPVQNVEVN